MAAQPKNALSLMGVDSPYLLSLRKAIAVASASTAIMMQDCSLDRFREYVIHAREHKELQIALKSTEMALFLKEGTKMKPSSQVRLCYKLLDTDGEGIRASKLTEAMQKIQDTSVIGEKMAIAERATRYDSKDGTGILTLDDLERFLTRLQTELECSFGEVCQLCVSMDAFGSISTDGRSVLEEMIAQNCRDNKEEDFENSVTRARLVLVFQMMDIKQSGQIPFRSVVKHLFRFAQRYEWEGLDVLLIMDDDDDNRILSMDEFLEFMLNFTSSLRNRRALHEITNAMPLSKCRETVFDHDIIDLFVDKTKRFEALQADTTGFEDVVAHTKLHQLHGSMDTDNSGKLDQFEIVLSLRKSNACRFVASLTKRRCRCKNSGWCGGRKTNPLQLVCGIAYEWLRESITRI